MDKARVADDRADLKRRLLAEFDRLDHGDLGALDDIWALTAERLYGLALWRCGREADAADAVQETWICLARAARKGQLGQIGEPLAYLLTITRRCAIDQMRSRRDHLGVEDLTDGELRLLEPESDHPSNAVDADRALSRLPTDQREAVYLRLFTGLSFREIGEAAQIPQFTAASRFRLAIETLRRLLGDRHEP